MWHSLFRDRTYSRHLYGTKEIGRETCVAKSTFSKKIASVLHVSVVRTYDNACRRPIHYHNTNGTPIYPEYLFVSIGHTVLYLSDNPQENSHEIHLLTVHLTVHTVQEYLDAQLFRARH